MTRTLAVRLDSDGDVLLTGPAVRALAAASDRLDLLVSPAGRAAAGLLPGVDRLTVFDVPWSGFRPAAVNPAAISALVVDMTHQKYDLAVVFTSFHQSPLPMALLARMAGVPRIVADSEDYPGSLLDVRHRRQEVHEVEAALQLATAAGAPATDDSRLRVSIPPGTGNPAGGSGYVVLHPGASVPSRGLLPAHAHRIAAELVARGHRVVITGGPQEVELAAAAYAPGCTDLAGRTDLAELAAVLRAAACVVTGNTGPAHLAAAVGTPVVSLFSPVVPAGRWAPYGVPVVLLGDQQAPCAGSRARECPVPGHPCLSGVSAAEVARAVERFAGPIENTVSAGDSDSVMETDAEHTDLARPRFVDDVVRPG
ncbi:glycosyltransferase family 9 protein [Kineosporia sp. J2-2]|uniref:Glycosyltransferase family 9 protein n=1 Tax=Kineosporia corallincola TaxID=2835133 RepID=A0ABS5TF07_9ACTN|nr:glycosyltransferase family 9 protein [Kineosporia corallincola]MBT0769630.1 glycosyltransferase family 9 protein [Kineosporia corallincola]